MSDLPMADSIELADGKRCVTGDTLYAANSKRVVARVFVRKYVKNRHRRNILIECEPIQGESICESLSDCFSTLRGALTWRIKYLQILKKTYEGTAARTGGKIAECEAELRRLDGE